MLFDMVFESKSYFTPSITIKMYNSSISQDLTNRLRDIVILEEPNILANVPPKDPDDADWMTGRLWNYNFLDLDYEEVRQLKSWIKEQYIYYMGLLNHPPEKVYIQCWVNIIRNNGRRIIPHHHADGHSSTVDAPQEYSYLSGNLCIQTVETNTWFRNPFLNKKASAIKNIDGEMIFFPSFITHWTDVNKSEKPRITISFDLVTEEFYNQIDNKNYRLL